MARKLPKASATTASCKRQVTYSCHEQSKGETELLKVAWIEAGGRWTPQAAGTVGLPEAVNEHHDHEEEGAQDAEGRRVGEKRQWHEDCRYDTIKVTALAGDLKS